MREQSIGIKSSIKEHRDYAVWENSRTAVAAVRDCLSRLRVSGVKPVWAAIYGTGEVLSRVRPQLEEMGAWLDWPLMELRVPGLGEGGFQVIGISGAEIKPILDVGRVVGMMWSDAESGKRASLCGLAPEGEMGDESGALSVMEKAGELLSQAGLDWQDVYRTWFFNRDILSWYDGFNRTRKDYFKRHGIDLGVPPASTGIGLENSWDQPLTLSLLAARPGVKPGPVDSPMQAPASNYGSFFSRATEDETGGHRCLWISGTASIDLSGATLHLDDFVSQVKETYAVVEALVLSRRMRWKDVCRATAYVRNPSDITVLRQMERDGDIPSLEMVVIPATVCRDNLLFELELDLQS